VRLKRSLSRGDPETAIVPDQAPQEERGPPPQAL